jgi:hypothetical protein
MGDPNLQANAPVRLRAMGALVVIAAMLATGATARAASPPTTTAAPGQVLTAPPNEIAVVPAVRVLDMPSTLGPAGMHQLATELRVAEASTVVVVRTPRSLKLAPSVTDGAVAELAAASAASQPYVIGDTGEVLTFLQRSGVRFERISSQAELPREVVRSDAVDGGTLSGSSLKSLLGPAPESSDGGVSKSLIVLAALLLGALGLGARRMLAPRRRPSVPVPHAPDGVTDARRPRPSPPTPRRRRPPLPDDPRLATSGRALVRSELRPEGYVELASCLRRVRWGDPRREPPPPGEWVDVRGDHGRLTAFPSNRTGKGHQR